jgi:hypothetical protein
VLLSGLRRLLRALGTARVRSTGMPRTAPGVGAISLGYRPDGSRIRRKVTGRTKTGVRDKLEKLQAEADTRLKTSASYTPTKAVDDWAALGDTLPSWPANGPAIFVWPALILVPGRFSLFDSSTSDRQGAAVASGLVRGRRRLGR